MSVRRRGRVSGRGLQAAAAGRAREPRPPASKPAGRPVSWLLLLPLPLRRPTGAGRVCPELLPLVGPAPPTGEGDASSGTPCVAGRGCPVDAAASGPGRRRCCPLSSPLCCEAPGSDSRSSCCSSSSSSSGVVRGRPLTASAPGAEPSDADAARAWGLHPLWRSSSSASLGSSSGRGPRLLHGQWKGGSSSSSSAATASAIAAAAALPLQMAVFWGVRPGAAERGAARGSPAQQERRDARGRRSSSRSSSGQAAAVRRDPAALAAADSAAGATQDDSEGDDDVGWRPPPQGQREQRQLEQSSAVRGMGTGRGARRHPCQPPPAEQPLMVTGRRAPSAPACRCRRRFCAGGSRRPWDTAPRCGCCRLQSPRALLPPQPLSLPLCAQQQQNSSPPTAHCRSLFRARRLHHDCQSVAPNPRRRPPFPAAAAGLGTSASAPALASAGGAAGGPTTAAQAFERLQFAHAQLVRGLSAHRLVPVTTSAAGGGGAGAAARGAPERPGSGGERPWRCKWDTQPRPGHRPGAHCRCRRGAIRVACASDLGAVSSSSPSVGVPSSRTWSPSRPSMRAVAPLLLLPPELQQLGGGGGGRGRGAALTAAQCVCSPFCTGAGAGRCGAGVPLCAPEPRPVRWAAAGVGCRRWCCMPAAQGRGAIRN